MILTLSIAPHREDIITQFRRTRGDRGKGSENRNRRTKGQAKNSMSKEEQEKGRRERMEKGGQKKLRRK